MKLSTVVKITISSSLVLLCAGFVLYSFLKLSAAGNKTPFNLYTLVSPSVSTVLDVHDIEAFVSEVDAFVCDKKMQNAEAFRSFLDLKQCVYSVLERMPHGLNRQTKRLLVSFHESGDDSYQVFYCHWGSNEQVLIQELLQEQVSGGYPPKVFEYKKEKILIYPLKSGGFLSCYLTPDFFVFSGQKRLIEEVIDVHKTQKSLAHSFFVFGKQVHDNAVDAASVYARLDGVMGWTEFGLRLKDRLVYLSGVTYEEDVFVNAISRQEKISGLFGELLPATTFYYTLQGKFDYASCFSSPEASADVEANESCEVDENNKKMARYLIEHTGQEVLSCLFNRGDTLSKFKPGGVVSFPVVDVVEARKMLRSWATPRVHSIYELPRITLLSHMAPFAVSDSLVFATFHEGRLLLAPDTSSLLAYMHYLGAGEVLEATGGFQQMMDELSDFHCFVLMADWPIVDVQLDAYAHFIPRFLRDDSVLFRHFTFFVQVTHVNDTVYPSIVLKYSEGGCCSAAM